MRPSAHFQGGEEGSHRGQGGKGMATPYNHRAVEQKWRKIWEEHPVNVNDGKSRNITVWICSRIRQETVCMSGTGEDM